jgi:hypothetical protein
LWEGETSQDRQPISFTILENRLRQLLSSVTITGTRNGAACTETLLAVAEDTTGGGLTATDGSFFALTVVQETQVFTVTGTFQRPGVARGTIDMVAFAGAPGACIGQGQADWNAFLADVPPSDTPPGSRPVPVDPPGSPTPAPPAPPPGSQPVPADPDATTAPASTPPSTPTTAPGDASQIAQHPAVPLRDR